MANTARKTAWVVVAAAMLTAPGAVSGADTPATSEASHPHVRSHSPAILALIRQASERSATFRDLLETINASSGIVYVEVTRSKS